VIEFGRNVVGLKDPIRTEWIHKLKDPVIYLMKDQRGTSSNKGGTMRLGAYPCAVTKGFHAYKGLSALN